MGKRQSSPPVRIDADLIRGGLWAKLSPPAAKVIIALMVHVDRTGVCWPSVATIQNLSGLGRTATYDAMRELRGLGLLTTETKGGGRADDGDYRETVRRLSVREGELINPSTVRQDERRPSASADQPVREGGPTRPRGRTHQSARPDTEP